MLSTVQELKLIARCIATDDRDAFGALVVAYQDSLRRFLLNLTLGNAVLTDDLAQETFLKAWISIRTFKGIAKFRTWLFRIAYNEFISWKRKEHDDLDYDMASNPAAPDAYAGIDARMDIKTLMTALNDKERTVILLYYLEDMPIKKIVDITSIPEGTVKVYLARAREKMAQISD